MNTFFNFIKAFFYLAFAACLITLCCFLFAGCRSAKIDSRRQKTSEQISTQVEVKKQESVVATTSITTQEQGQKEGYNSWSIALSSDSDAVPFSFTLLDGSVIAGRSKSFSGTGKMSETRTASTQQQKTEQHQATSDSSAKQETVSKQELQEKHVERKANSFWRSVALVLLAIAIIFLVGFYVKSRGPHHFK